MRTDAPNHLVRNLVSYGICKYDLKPLYSHSIILIFISPFATSFNVVYLCLEH
jgi:hypothetical protein